MQRFRLFGLVIIAVFALSVAVTSATASAEEGGNPTLLPTPTEKEFDEFKSKEAKKGGGTTELAQKEGKGAITCTTYKNAIKFTSKRLGVITVDLGGCKLGATACNSEGDAAETILIDSAHFHLVDLKLAGNVLDLGAVVKLVENIKIKCGGLIKIEVKGSVMGLIDGVNDLVKTKTFTILFHQAGGVQELKECFLTKEFCEPGGVKAKFLLEANFGGGFGEVGFGAKDELESGNEVEFHF